VLVARTAALGVGVRRAGVAAGEKRLTAYVSAAAHGCIAQAMDLSGLGTAALRIIPTNDRHQIDLHALTLAIAEDRHNGFTPFVVIGTAGTVDTGAIDDLAALAEIARREQLWFHVDGAFGALAILAPDLAPRLAGIAQADSIALDFHKWAQVPYDAGFLLVRDGTLHHDTFAAPAAYLRRETRGLAAGSPWPCDFGPDLSRGFRALKTWFTLKVHGTDAIGAVISRTCALARDLEKRIVATPELELLAPVELNIVCFRYRAEDADRVNARIVVDLQESGIVAPSTTRIGDRLAIRAAIVNHRTDTQDVDALVDAAVALGNVQMLKRLSKPPTTIDAAQSGLMAQDLMAQDSAAKDRPDQSQSTDARPPAVPIGLPTLIKMAFDGRDLAPVWNELVGRVNDDPHDAAAIMDLATIAHIQGRPGDRAALQSWALKLQRIYRQPSSQRAARTTSQPLRLLAFMAPGDFMANMPIGFLLEGTNVALDMVYVVPGLPLPQPLPDHDVAFVAAAESNENQAVLRQIAALVRSWRRPVVNAPKRIAQLTRDGTWTLLRSAPGVQIPINARVGRGDLERIAGGMAAVENVLDGGTFPIIVRPLDSHAGDGLIKLECAAEIGAYLHERPEGEFYIAPFVDYRGGDGLFRKYRIALIDGRPYAVHMGISAHWMIHYLNAGMVECAEKRAEEARFMADFDTDFAVRHATALHAIAERAGLDYLPFDCGETRDGKLLVFETGTNMVVHAMDPPDLFPYKQPQMQKVFGSFAAMLRNRAAPAPVDRMYLDRTTADAA
jgi:glutamate/tyrosine decarboxylase-like PLP-dependent enzyme